LGGNRPERGPRRALHRIRRAAEAPSTANSRPTRGALRTLSAI
jgi:hypothetical protein